MHETQEKISHSSDDHQDAQDVDDGENSYRLRVACLDASLENCEADDRPDAEQGEKCVPDVHFQACPPGYSSRWATPLGRKGECQGLVVEVTIGRFSKHNARWAYKHRRFWFTEVNRKSLFRRCNQCACVDGREKRLFSVRVGPPIIYNSEIVTSGWLPWIKNVCALTSWTSSPPPPPPPGGTTPYIHAI